MRGRAARAEGDTPRDPSDARLVAMNALARREHSQKELVEKLVRAGFESDVAADAVAALHAEGLQDDRRYAESAVASYARRGKGPVRLRHDLAERGVAPELINAALDASSIDWFAVAREVRERKFGAAVPGEFSQKAKQMRFLNYRGFSSDQIAAAFDSA